MATQLWQARFRSGRLLHAAKHLVAHIADEVLHVRVHLLHAFAHLQDDGNAGDVDPKIPGKVQDELQPFQILIRVEPGVPFRARRTQQPLPLVEAQRLRMNGIHLRHGGDHVRAFRFTLGRHGAATILTAPVGDGALVVRLP